MKKLISILICLAIVMSLGVTAMAALKDPNADSGKDLGGNGSSIKDPSIGGGTATKIEQAIADFKAKVEALPETITLEHKTAIEEAKAALENVKTLAGRNWELGGQKSLQDWINKLDAASAQYDALVAAQQPVNPNPGIDKTGDGTVIFFVLAALSMTGLVVLVSKKRAF